MRPSHAPAAYADRSGISLGQLVAILWWRRSIVIGLFVAIVGFTAAFSLLTSPTYKATATVIIDVKRSDPVFGPLAPTSIPPGFIATQVDIINSPRVALRAVKTLGIEGSPTAIQIWEKAGKPGTIEQFFADRLLKGVEARPSRESNVVSIQYTGSDPQFTANVANAFARSYVETSVELLADPARSSAIWFDARVKQLKEGLEAAQARLSAYQREHQVLATDERVDVETARLNELNAQLTSIQGQHSESASRERHAQGQMNTSPDVLQNPVIQGLRTDIARAEAKYNELSEQLGKNHPQLQRTKAELDSLRARMEAEMKQVAGTVSTNNNVNQQREAETVAALRAQKLRLLELRSQRDELSVLQKEVDNAQRAYDVAAQRLSQTSLESQAQQTNIQLLSEAVPPTQKASPHITLNILISAVLGMLVSGIAGVGKEFADRRLRTAEDAARIYGLPVLARLSGPNRRTFALPVMPWARLRAKGAA